MGQSALEEGVGGWGGVVDKGGKTLDERFADLRACLGVRGHGVEDWYQGGGVGRGHGGNLVGESGRSKGG